MEQSDQLITTTIRVLIADSNHETRERTRETLLKERDIEVVGVGKNGKEAIELSQGREPDVVILDVNLGDMDELETTEAICRRLPFVQVIILADEVDAGYMRRAMLAGARDFLVKPTVLDELRSAVYRAGSLAQDKRVSSMRVLPRGGGISTETAPMGGGHVILVYSPKGGTGTTTLAVNLAIALHSPQARAVIVDANLQYGDVGVYVNETGYHSILDLTSRIDDLDPDVISSVIVNHVASGVDVMIAPNRPEMAEKVSGEDFFKVIQYLRRHYSYVIVDTPSELGEITLAAFDAADFIVLLTTQEIPAIKNTRLFLTVADNLHIPRSQILFVMNRYDRQIAISPERISDNLKLEVAEVIPVDLKTAIRAENQGQPFVLEKKVEPIGRAIVHLGETLRERINAQAKTEIPAGKSGQRSS